MKINLSKNTKKVVNWGLLIGAAIVTSITSQNITNQSNYDEFKNEMRKGMFKLREID